MTKRAEKSKREEPVKSPVIPPSIPSHPLDYMYGSTKTCGLPSSRSEPTLQFASHSTDKEFTYTPLQLVDRTRRTRNEQNQKKDNIPRGRGQLPTKESYSVTSPPKTPTKRSRSPMKRLLGLGKSESSKNVTLDESAQKPERPLTPTSKKKSMQKWSERLRHGFLVSASLAT
jgi:hypothetical protein